MKTFDEIFIDQTKYGVKVQTSEYGKKGKYIIIDQGKSQIAGYTDREEGVFKEVPALVFGDHTKAIKYVDKPFFLGADGVKVLRSKDSDANYKYLYYALKNVKIPNTGYNRHFKWLKEIQINYPNKNKQDIIVRILDKVSDIMQKREAELSTLDGSIKSRFIEMFGNETEFDKWPCCTVGDVADVYVGVVIKPTQYYADKGIPAFRSLNIGEMYVKDSDWVYFTEEGNQKNQKSVVHKNDVLVIRSGAPGTACVVTEKYDGYNAVDIIIAHPDSSIVNPIFLAAFTNMPHGMKQIRERTGGAAQQHFNVGGYKALKLIKPPLNLQEEFAAFVAQTDKSRVEIQKSLDETQLLFDSLMQKYFG